MLPINTVRRVVWSKHINPDLTSRANGAINHCSHQSVNRILAAFRQSGIKLSEVTELADSALRSICYRLPNQYKSCKRQPDYENIFMALHQPKRQRKSLAILYDEYKKIDVATAYGKTHFYFLVERFLKQCKTSARQLHYAGDEVFIDYAGTTVTYSDNGVEKYAHIFVGCLGASKLMFAYATKGETTLDWIAGIVKMLIVLGGVPKFIVIDNAKALVSKAGKSPVLNKMLEELADHYNCLIHTCRVRHPQDKSLAELAVKFITQRVLRLMNSDFTFFSLEEINQHLAFEVDKLNRLPIQRLKQSRLALFKTLDEPMLAKLPLHPFEPVIDYCTRHVHEHCHITYNNHDYSVPYHYIGKKVEVTVKEQQLTCSHDHDVIVTHPLATEAGCSTIPAHLPPNQQAELAKNRDYYIHWGKDVGNASGKLMKKLFSTTENPQSKAIICRAALVQALAKKVGYEVFEAACQYALTHGKAVPCADELKMIISAKAYDKVDTPDNTTFHPNIRGKDYCGGGEHE